MKTGRNEPCACGSGKKTKHCCGKNDPGMAQSNRIGLIIGAIVVVAAVGVIASMRNETKRDPFSPFETSTAAPTETAAVAAPPVTSTAPADAPVAKPGPQPPGPAPAGKVWSPEHGHWHDKVETDPNVKIETTQLPAPAASAQPAVNIPKPNIPTPPGKVWSPEHGHWHDAATGVAPVTEIPAELESQMKPPGAPAAPAGMVWSEEHKHWHKSAGPTTATTTTSAPAPATTTNP